MSEIHLKGVGGKLIKVNTGLFIGNEFVTAHGDRTLDVENPSTSTLLARVSAAGKEDVDAAVIGAAATFQGDWGRVSPAVRGQLLGRLATLIERDADELASIEALDAGILFGESKGLHVAQTVETLRYFAGWADKITGETLHIPQGFAQTHKEPIGVCAAIIPWNSPLMITSWKLAPAIAAGNTLVLKTPELAPLYGQKLAALIKEAGFPPNVINIITGEGHVAGQALAEHSLVKKLAFTGSGAVGRSILKAAASTNLKKVTVELGGKGPSIIFADADFDNAISWAVLGITANNGQVCAAGSRIYVHSSMYERFLVAFGERVVETSHGDPLEPTTTKGPVVSKKQKTRILEYVQDAKASGIDMFTTGASEALAGDGHFVPNVVFRDVPDDARIMKEEVFGPVASIAKFDTEEEVISKANATEYGLSAAIFTNDVNRSHRVSAALQCGQVTVNCWGLLHANTPFGGVKQSGFGRDMGREALEEWLVTKTVKYNILQSTK